MDLTLKHQHYHLICIKKVIISYKIQNFSNKITKCLPKLIPTANIGSDLTSETTAPTDVGKPESTIIASLFAAARATPKCNCDSTISICSGVPVERISSRLPITKITPKTKKYYKQIIEIFK